MNDKELLKKIDIMSQSIEECVDRIKILKRNMLVLSDAIGACLEELELGGIEVCEGDDCNGGHDK